MNSCDAAQAWLIPVPSFDSVAKRDGKAKWAGEPWILESVRLDTPKIVKDALTVFMSKFVTSDSYVRTGRGTMQSMEEVHSSGSSSSRSSSGSGGGSVD